MMACCLWCQREFPAAKRGDREKEFCGDRCRAAFHRQARRWAVAAVKAGLLNVETLKQLPKPVEPHERMAPQAPYTAQPRALEVADHDR